MSLERRLLAVAVLLAAAAASAWAQEPAPAPEHTVAILNFANRRPGDGWDWLGKGLADMLISDLDGAPGVRLLTREDMQLLFDEMRLGATGLVDAESAQQFGQTVAVDRVLTGSFVADDGRLTIEAHTVSVASGKLLRVDSVKGDLDRALSLEKDLALEILANMDVTLTEGERQAILAMPTLSLDATRHLYLGVDAVDRGLPFDGLACLHRALRADPGFAKARLWAGRVYRGVGKWRHASTEFSRLPADSPESRLAPEAMFLRAKLVEKFSGGPPEDSVNAYAQMAHAYRESGWALLAGYRAAVLAYQTDQLPRARELIAFTRRLPGERGMPGSSWCRNAAEALGEKIDSVQDAEAEQRKEGLKLGTPAPSAVKPEEVLIARDPESHLRSGLFPRPGSRVTWLEIRAAPGRRLWKLGVAGMAAPDYARRDTGRSRRGPRDLSSARTGRVRPRSTADEGGVPQKPFASVEVYDAQENVFLGRCELPKDRAAVSELALHGGPTAVRVRVEQKATVVRPVFVASTKPASSRAKKTDQAEAAADMPRDMPSVWYMDGHANWALRDIEDDLVTLAPAEGGVFYPRLAEDRHGALWLVYNDQCNGRMDAVYGGDADIWIASAKHVGKWSRPRRLPVSTDGHDLQPCLVIDRDDVLHLFWSAQRARGRVFDILTSTSRDGIHWSFPAKCGLQWMARRKWDRERAAQGEKGEDCFGLFSPAVAQDGAGAFHMAYLSFSGDPGYVELLYGSAAIAASTDGVEWTDCRLIREEQFREPFSLVADRGRLVLCAGVKDRPVLLTSADGGKSWSRRQLRDDHDRCFLTLAPDGRLLLSFCQSLRFPRWRESLDGSAWADHQALGPGGGLKRDGPGLPFVIRDSRGRYVATWGSIDRGRPMHRPHILTWRPPDGG
jgi:TolB-like protein